MQNMSRKVFFFSFRKRLYFIVMATQCRKKLDTYSKTINNIRKWNMMERPGKYKYIKTQYEVCGLKAIRYPIIHHCGRNGRV